jgi:protein SCO1/2
MLFVMGCMTSSYSREVKAARESFPRPEELLIETNLQTYTVRGVVKELQPDGKTVLIKHEEVTNFMPAMTMPFEVKNTNQLKGLKPGDAVEFSMVVGNYDAWISQIHITNWMAASNAPVSMVKSNSLPEGVRVVKDVEALSLGDELPEYHFTNELGRAISTREFRGQAFAFTFFFTRCPFPTFCPKLSGNFQDAQKKLLSMTNAPANWHLFSISFDVKQDTLEELKAYGERYAYDPAHWSFLTGNLDEITAIGDSVGENFGHDETGGVTHNLRTVVINAKGRVQKIWRNNDWTGDDLAAELLEGK